MRSVASALALATACAAPAAQTSSTACLLVDQGFGPKGTVAVRAVTVASGLEVPWGIAFLPNGDALVTERPGRLRLVRSIAARRDGDGTPMPVVARLPVQTGTEGGLLGVALHPAFATNRLFYLYFTALERGRSLNRVERWRLAPDSSSAVFDKLIIDGIPSAAYHNGGRIRFGPDGMLYVGTGDGAEPELSQDLRSLGGKILRLTPEGSVPEDNPFPGSPVFILGLRNTQGFDFPDPKRLYITDHGPSGEFGRQGHDEVNVAVAGDNLGWPTIFGCQSAAGMVSPLLAWRAAVPPGGAALYTGSEIAEWKGSLLIGTLRSRHLHRVKFGPGPQSRVELQETYFDGEPPSGFGRLRDVEMAPGGALYLTTSNCDGRGECPRERDRILRVVKAVP